MGGEMTRVTVLGSVVIVAMILIVFLAIQAWTKRNSGESGKE
jgi:hypothetical protein